MLNPTDEFVRSVTESTYGHLEQRTCTAEAPMPLDDKDNFRWHHPDAVEIKPFFNLVLCECPHCKFSFTCLPAHDVLT